MYKNKHTNKFSYNHIHKQKIIDIYIQAVNFNNNIISSSYIIEINTSI